MGVHTKSLLKFGLFVGVVLLVAACTRPQSMLVREGGDPIHADRDVAFRTTYYFRVFDYCSIRDRLDGKPVAMPLNDTLYRFIMTGKASTILSNIRFESGTLSAQEIEPFGSAIEYDKELGRFRFHSRQDVEAEARREQTMKAYDRLFVLYDKITEIKKDDSRLTILRTEIVDTLKAFIAEFRRSTTSLPDSLQAQNVAGRITATELPVTAEDGNVSISFSVQGPQPAPERFTLVLESKEGQLPKATLQKEEGAAVATLAPPAGPVDCLKSGIPTRRGFQILGPEGWRTFDQDERLLLAMSADSQPLIGTLKELSQRLIQSRSQTLAYQRVLPIERLRVANTNQSLDSTTPEDTPETILNRTIGTFNSEAGGP